MALGLVAVAARLYALDRQSFWYDEAISVVLADNSLADLLSGRAKDLGNPPLYPVLLRIWSLLFGSSDVAVRALSAVLGMATVPLVYLVGRRTMGARTAFVGALLFAVAPFQVQMAQEARTYTLLTFLAAASVAALMGALASPTRWWRWVLFGVVTGLMPLSHYFGFFLCVAEAGYVAFAHRRDRWILLRATGAFLLAAAVFAFWLPAFLDQLGVQGNLARSAESWHLHFAATPLVFAFGSTLVWKDTATAWRLVIALLAIAVFVGGLILGMLRTQRRPRFGLLATWLVVPIALPTLVSLAFSPLYNTRYVILSSVPFYLFVAAGLMAVPRTLALASATVLAGAALTSQVSYLRTPVKHQWRQAAALVEGQQREGDLLVFAADYNESAYAHYARKPATRLRLMPPPEGAPAARLHGAVKEGAPTTDLTDIIQGHRRVWLILSDADELTAERARAFFTRPDGGWRAQPPVSLRGVTVQLFEKGP